jgi:hypothetical protein
MGATTVGKSGTALIAFTGSGTVPQWLAIGTGSSSFAIGDTALVTENQKKIYTSRQPSTSRKVNWTFDFDSLAMSGITLTELGLFNNSAATSGNMFNRESIVGVVFDGTNELTVDLEYEIY